jgi:SSS family solute:Na+ symporter
MTLTPLDYGVMAIPLIAVSIIAFRMRVYAKSVADYLAANRCAGRYLICTSTNQLNSSVVGLVVYLEMFSATGASTGFWTAFSAVFIFIFTLFGVITFRFRETRCLTFHQFFETRYSKGLRVFSSLIAFFSGLIGFGLTPAVGARFFVYFCGMPPELHFGTLVVPTFSLVMAALMAVSLFLVLTGGQISVMMTDATEGLISSIFYLVVIFFIVFTISTSRMEHVLLSGARGHSYINPFDISKQPEFDGWYIFMLFLFNIYVYRGGAWNQAFSAAARTAHEGKMAGIIAMWRGFGASCMVTMVAFGAFVVLHDPYFATQRQLALNELQVITNPQLQTQMTMPAMLGELLVPGVKGAFCAIGLFGLISSQGVALHGFGSTALQDIILPMKKTPFSPRAHLFALRLAAAFVAGFVCIFSFYYEPSDYLTMIGTLIAAIYLGGVGAVVWGGLYWKKGTSAAAWTAMITGTSLALVFNIVQPFWTRFQPLFLRWSGHGGLHDYLLAHPDRCPITGQTFSTSTALVALTLYIVVSLLTCKEDFDMDRLLHRGKYKIPSEDDTREPLPKGFSWGKVIGIDEHFTAGDKAISIFTFCWAVAWKISSISILTYWLLHGPQSDKWWFNFTMVSGVWIPVVVSVITTVWLTIATIRDMADLFRTLRTVSRNDADDGTVRQHHNLGEENLMGEQAAGVVGSGAGLRNSLVAQEKSP